MRIKCKHKATRRLGGFLPSKDDGRGEHYDVPFNKKGEATVSSEVGKHLAKCHDHISIVKEG